MWLPNSILYSLIASLFLAGCGFQPLYAQRKNDPISAQLLSGITIEPVMGEKRMAQQFKADLEDRLNPSGAVPGNPMYRLRANLTDTTSPIGVAPDGTVSRYNVYLTSTYTLIRSSDGVQMTSGSITHVSSYNNVTNAYFSTYVSERDAIKRGIGELAEMTRQRLASYLVQNNGRPPVQGKTATPPPTTSPLQNVLEPTIRSNSYENRF